MSSNILYLYKYHVIGCRCIFLNVKARFCINIYTRVRKLFEALSYKLCVGLLMVNDRMCYVKVNDRM